MSSSLRIRQTATLLAALTIVSPSASAFQPTASVTATIADDNASTAHSALSSALFQSLRSAHTTYSVNQRTFIPAHAFVPRHHTLTPEAIHDVERHLEDIRQSEQSRQHFFGRNIPALYSDVDVSLDSVDAAGPVHGGARAVTMRFHTHLTDAHGDQHHTITSRWHLEFNETNDVLRVLSDDDLRDLSTPDSAGTREDLLGSSASATPSTWELTPLAEREALEVATTHGARDAVAYAKKHYNSYNPDYPDYSDMGGDCANFVSQALHAGGWDMTATTDPNNQQLWYSTKTWSSQTWRAAENLFHYMRDVEEKKAIRNVWAAQPGDVIQFRQKDKNRMQHTMIVVGRARIPGTYWTEPLLAQHSSDQIYRRLSSIYRSDRVFYATKTF